MAKKIGLALAGGGARGAYQIGAWKALKEFDVFDKIDVFSGASVGSLNAVLFAMGDYDLAYDTWMNLDKDTLFKSDKNIFKRFINEKLSFFEKGIFKTDELERIMTEVVDFELIKDKKVFVATTRIGDKDAHFYDVIKANYKHYFKKDQQVDYYDINNYSFNDKKKVLLASCAIPIVFKPVQIQGKTYYDGGVLDNAPYEPLIDAGCDVIIVVDLYTFSQMRLTREKRANLFVCYPKKGLRGILDFRNEYLLRRFDLGYQDMKKLLETHIDEILD